MDKEKSDYIFEFSCKPDFGFATVTIPANQMLKVEASAMATMDTTIKMKTRIRGGLGRLLTGESLFINEFLADQVSGTIGIAPPEPGDIEHVYLENETIFVQNASYVASSPNLSIDTKWQGFIKGFFSGNSFFMIRCHGVGDLFFSSFGAMVEIDVDGEYIVDSGHIVAFTEGLEYRIDTIAGLKSLFFSGEGLVCRFSGKGKIWIQTRSSSHLASFLETYRPVKNDN